jgi:hypothetical protein
VQSLTEIRSTEKASPADNPIAVAKYYYYYYLCKCQKKKSGLHFHGSKVINNGGHFVLCSEDFVNNWAVEGLEKLRIDETSDDWKRVKLIIIGYVLSLTWFLRLWNGFGAVSISC